MATPSISTGSGVKISGMRAKTNIRLQQIARYRITGRLTDTQIAERVGLTGQGIARILALPEYKDLEESLLQGHISKMDEEIAGNVTELRAYMTQAVPIALRTLVETVQQRQDLRAALTAAGEILDRDPDKNFVKVSRQQGGGADANIFNPGNDAGLVASLTAIGNQVSVQIKTGAPTINVQTAPSTDVLPPTPQTKG